ncbi:S8 family serine peptidase [Lishizhenia tianjinensis]|nr:S8 family serine peptidase [Lishizhenia tianjinensis]
MKFVITLMMSCALIMFSSAQEKAFAPQQLLVQLQPHTNLQAFQSELAQNGLEQTDISLLSKNMSIYLLVWSDATISNAQAMSKVRACKGVINLQNNHFIQERETIPTDPSFANTWHHKNTGQTGGTTDNDIDTPDAWDITTGGVTATGDTIVVCILEGGGANMNHPDLVNNIYHNHHEIPNNNIDDDGNGYVDDVNGWNVNLNSDTHSSGNHGTAVMGMIGASANNGIGSTGVNHNVKMMLVSGFNMSESSVIAAYDYPLTQRKLYNQSAGSNGAFVVATNASWGIDGANPANYPLWCAYYDTLGVHGILNCGATTNQNFNVDTGGDMPTACGSDYMISVTASNHNDQRTFSGYGATTIDLAAPGESVLLPSGSSSYATTSGTSFASPCVAGAIALAYSAPCASFASIYASNPQAGANYVRLNLLNTVDAVPSLASECVTGGRLNVNNMILQIMGNCGTGCITPYTSSLVSNDGGMAEFNVGSFSPNNYIYIKEQGATTWDSVGFSGSNISISNLTYCTDYMVRFAGDCSGNLSNYSDTLYFKTDGCCDAPQAAISVLGAADASISWPSVTVGTAYTLEYAPTGSGAWTSINNVSSPYALTGLDTCTVYDIQMSTTCADSSSTNSNIEQFETTGCGACTDVAYCAVDNGNTQYEFINKIMINNFNLITGDNDGYRPTENTGVILHPGNTYPFSIQPGYTGGAFTDDLLAWIDFNQNGIFENSELIMDFSSNSQVTQNVTIPTDAVLGRTRVRFMIFGSSSTASPCFAQNFWGEVEDYCININSNVGVDAVDLENQISIAPNPNTGSFVLYGVPLNTNISIFSVDGRQMGNFSEYQAGETLDISSYPKGVYLIKLSVNNQSITKRIVKQ